MSRRPVTVLLLLLLAATPAMAEGRNVLAPSAVAANATIQAQQVPKPLGGTNTGHTNIIELQSLSSQRSGTIQVIKSLSDGQDTGAIIDNICDSDC